MLTKSEFYKVPNSNTKWYKLIEDLQLKWHSGYSALPILPMSVHKILLQLGLSGKLHTYTSFYSVTSFLFNSLPLTYFARQTVTSETNYNSRPLPFTAEGSKTKNNWWNRVLSALWLLLEICHGIQCWGLCSAALTKLRIATRTINYY